jgi:hypothetical protein
VSDIVIDPRFNGPPRSANGGYACGVTARAFPDTPAEVSLLAPPPIGEPLTLEAEGGVARLTGASGPIAEARVWDGDVEPPAPVSFEQAELVRSGFDVEGYRGDHPFPRCFACGPDRSSDDGLTVFPGPVGDGGMVVWPWTPHASVGDDEGLVDAAVVWAALDCPSGLAWISLDAESSPAVLARLAVRIDRRPHVGESLVVAGWQVSKDGRKRRSGSVVWSDDGEVVARGAATWVVLTPEQAEAFGAS